MISLVSWLSVAVVTLLMTTTEAQVVNLLPVNTLDVSQLLNLPLHLEVGTLFDGVCLNVPLSLIIYEYSIVENTQCLQQTVLLNLTIEASLDVGNASVPIRIEATLGNPTGKATNHLFKLFPISVIVEIGNQVIPMVITLDYIFKLLQNSGRVLPTPLPTSVTGSTASGSTASGSTTATGAATATTTSWPTTTTAAASST